MSRREQYLEALGVDLWRSRALAPSSVPPPVLAPAPRSADAPAWQALRAEVSVCTRCELSRGRTQTVFGVGNTQAELLVIGEAPGAEEDRQGEPFVGRAGQLLNSMLRAIGLAREQVFIANVLKCRPPGNRDPAASESAACSPYLERQIALLNPRIMLAVGRIAAQGLGGLEICARGVCTCRALSASVNSRRSKFDRCTNWTFRRSGRLSAPPISFLGAKGYFATVCAWATYAACSMWEATWPDTESCR